MADNYQEALIKAIETIAKSQVDELATDKTVTATIVSCVDLLTNEYKVSYNGGNMYAYASEGRTYTEGNSVYVLVPEGNFNKKKIILDKSTYKDEDENINFVSSLVNDYNLIGKNTLYEEDSYKVYPLGLKSYIKEDRALLYQRGLSNPVESGEKVLKLEAESLDLYMKKSDAFLIKAKFQTNLPKEHRSKGKYWLDIVIATEDGDKTIDEFENYLPKIIITENNSLSYLDIRDTFFKSGYNNINDNILLIEESSNSIDVINNENIDNKDEKIYNIKNIIDDYYKEIKNEISNLRNNSEIILNAVNDRYNLNSKENTDSYCTLKALKDFKDKLDLFLKNSDNFSIDENIKKNLNKIKKIISYLGFFFIEEEKVKTAQEKYQTFTLSSDKMTGDPHRYYNWSSQYIFCPINSNNFLYIESIVFRSEGFVEKDDIPRAKLNGNNIFVKDIELYGVKEISAVDGDFKLQIGTPQGSIFYTVNPGKELPIVAKVTKSEVDISDNVVYYWFLEDNEITSFSSKFNYYAGAGWRWLQDEKGNKSSIAVSSDENISYENNYKCVAVYNKEVILKTDLTIYNNASKRKIDIVSDIGNSFSFDRGIPTLTCLVNDKKEFFETPEEGFGEDARPDSNYKFIWSIFEDGKDIITCYDGAKEEIQAEINKIEKILANKEYPDDLNTEDEKQEYNNTQIKKRDNLNQQLSVLNTKNLEVNKNILQYPINSMNKVAKIKCGVKVKDNGTEEENKPYYNVGTAEIDLQNSSDAQQQKYYILITNGDQIFQYSESGVAPNNERYTDPLEVKSLECHFYDQYGYEVNKNTYDLKWKIPLEDTMIVTPSDNMVENPATANKELNIAAKKEWYQGSIYPLQIAESFNYLALNNQIKAIVTYDGQEYTQDTNLLFTKVGENGTNGTDVVCRIVPKNDYYVGQYSLIFKKEEDNFVGKWSSGERVGLCAPFELQCYNRDTLLDISNNIPKWSIAGGGVPKKNGEGLSSTRAKYLSIDSSTGVIDWNDDGQDEQVIDSLYLDDDVFIEDADGNKIKNNYNRFNNQIIKSEVKIKDDVTNQNNSYYAFLPIPTIKYFTNNKNNSVNRVKNVYIDDTETLKYITYNSDGRNPLFNKNQGIKIIIEVSEDDIDDDYYIKWTANGGANDLGENGSITSDIRLYYNKEGIYYNEDGGKENELSKLVIKSSDKDFIKFNETQENKIKKEYMIYVVPNDIYSGEYCNNIVKINIYDKKDKDDIDINTPRIEICIPICITLNTYGLASLNGWDGNHIEINEDENYILSPQIGAGTKNSDNTFTGLVMGKTGYYDKQDTTGGVEVSSSVGLLGYSHGKQSIWLDAETGKAVFGLPEYQASNANKYDEGRIELIPGGTSHIANWNIGSRVLYNIVDPDNQNKISKGYNDKYSPQLTTGEIKFDSSSVSYEDGNKDIPLYDIASGVVKSEYSISSENGRGILLSADPAYISIKGAPLTEKDAKDRNRNIKFSNKETEVASGYRSGKSELYLGDSLEIQLDANRGSLFSILQHTKKRDSNDKIIYDNNNKPKWERKQKVGIDAYGRFFANALKDSSVGMAPGFVEAFGETVSNHTYSGLTLEIGENDLASKTIFKAFTETTHKSDNPVYISGSMTGSSNEYSRPLQLYGKEIKFYTLPSGTEKISKQSDNFIAMPEEVNSNKCCHIKITKSNQVSDYQFGINEIKDIKGKIETKFNGNYCKIFKDNDNYLYLSNGKYETKVKTTSNNTDKIVSSVFDTAKPGVSLSVLQGDAYKSNIDINNDSILLYKKNNKENGVNIYSNGINIFNGINPSSESETGIRIKDSGTSSLELGNEHAYLKGSSLVQLEAESTGEIQITTYSNTITIGQNRAYGFKKDGESTTTYSSNGVQIAGNTYITGGLVVDNGIIAGNETGGIFKVYGDMSVSQDLYVENYMRVNGDMNVERDIVTNNIYWKNPGEKEYAKDATGNTNLWASIGELVNIYNNHTHQMSVNTSYSVNLSDFGGLLTIYGDADQTGTIPVLVKSNIDNNLYNVGIPEGADSLNIVFDNTNISGGNTSTVIQTSIPTPLISR